ncbi:hypothetical protein BV22DRAFT_1130108 [Leucogyrophana mollusca]|uniref:Uncharacterized protein n=1 Tax=Leucogyrophana mollusca TaxID=85980 RepID=A0ACB8BGY8_9AGAM|nr:hypothetical protein BV22DRAFT_1130108 [Leucogyrophana mollusca]
MDENDASTQVQQLKLEALCASIGTRTPTAAGPVISPEKLVLYHEGENAIRLDLSRASDARLRSLAQACQPATFGVSVRRVVQKSGEAGHHRLFDPV